MFTIAGGSAADKTASRTGLVLLVEQQFARLAVHSAADGDAGGGLDYSPVYASALSASGTG